MYADAILEPLQNFDTLLNEQYKFVISNEDPCDLDCYKKNILGNRIISFTANNHILTRMLSKKSCAGFTVIIRAYNTILIYKISFLKHTTHLLMLLYNLYWFI